MARFIQILSGHETDSEGDITYHLWALDSEGVIWERYWDGKIKDWKWIKTSMEGKKNSEGSCL